MTCSYSGAAYQSFLRHAKTTLMARLHPEMLRRARAAAAAGGLPNDPMEADASLRDRMGGDGTFGYYSWLERYIQFFKYRSRHGLVAEVARPDAPFRGWIAPPDAANLELGQMPVPAYYSLVDTHQHPGNLHGDADAGIVYKLSAATTQPGGTDGYGLHYRFADWLSSHLGDTAPRQIADLGCGFGKSTLPLAERWPAARIEGIDLSAGCLRLAAQEAADHGSENITYRQRDALATGFDGESFDLVTSTMVLHELDRGAMDAMHRESWRLLAPGGRLVHLDFKGRDIAERFFLHGHGVRNNEPYMAAHDIADTKAELEELGFVDVEIVPFAESERALDPGNEVWRLPWTVFTARKPGAAECTA